LVTGEFDEVTNDFGSVIARLNAHYGTSFDLFVPTDENRRRCFDLMKERATNQPEWYRMVLDFESGIISLSELLANRSIAVAGSQPPRPKRGPRPETRQRDTWIPSDQRAEVKAALKRSYYGPKLAHLRARAEDVYRAFIDAAVSHQYSRTQRHH
jgi:hypothetical protein